MPKVLRLSGTEGGHMCNKDVSKNYENIEMLERFQGWHIEFNKEILKVCEEQEVNLRNVFGKAIGNVLKNGEETREILQYAVDCFSVAKVSGVENLQLFGMRESTNCWRKAYLVELGEELWEIKIAVFVGKNGESIVNYSKAKLDKWEIQYDEDTGEVLGWIKPVVGQMIDIKQLRGI